MEYKLKKAVDDLKVLLGVKAIDEYFEKTAHKMEYGIECRSAEYASISHMDATDDLLGMLDYYGEKIIARYGIDGVSGEVGDKGYFTIYAYKNI